MFRTTNVYLADIPSRLTSVRKVNTTPLRNVMMPEKIYK